MGDFGNALKYLYSQFILRDVLSFITPGAIIVLSVFVLFLPEYSLVQRLDKLFEYSQSIHWLLYIPLFGVFYIVGFAIQCFGEITGLVRSHRIAKSSCCQRFKVFGCNWACKQEKQGESNECDFPDFIWWKEAHKEMVKFNKETQDEGKEWAWLRHERLVVLKQMCGNSSLSIFIAGIFLAVSFCPLLWVKLLIVSLVVFLLLASLFWGYRVHELRLDTMDKEIISQFQDNEIKKKGS